MKPRKAIRKFEIDIQDIRASKTVQASISSEYPVKRDAGYEVLRHTPESIDLSREPLPLIASHDTSRLNVGLVEGLKIVGGKLRGLIRFGDRAEAQDLWRDVRNGILKYLSIGYEILETELTKHGYVATKWRPYEVSLVSTPADPTVGIGRSKGNKTMKYNLEYIRELLNEMKHAEGAELERIGSEFDKVASVIKPEAPKFSEAGADAVLRWSNLSDGDGYRTPVGESSSRNERVFKSFGEQLKAIIDYGHPDGRKDPRLFKVRAATGLSEAVPSEGGFLLESPVSSEILDNVWTSNNLLKMIPKYQLTPNSNSMTFPGIDETSRADGSRMGGVQSYYTAEAAEYQATKPTFRAITLKPKKLIGLCYLTEELISDVNALEAYVTRAFKAELDFKIQDGIIRGSGVGQPLGILNSGAIISVAKEAGQAADTIVYQNVLKMWTRLFAHSRKNAVWVINQNCEPQLHQMSLAVGTGGAPVYTPMGGASVAPYASLFGRPVIPIEQCPNVGDTGDIMLCDFVNGGIAVDAGPARSDASLHVRFVYGEQVLRFMYRWDFQPVLASPITPFMAGDTQSHFIKLDERTT